MENQARKQVSTNIRVDKDVKEAAQALFKTLGLDMTTACNIFFRQCLREKGIPFSISQNPSKETSVEDVDGKI